METFNTLNTTESIGKVSDAAGLAFSVADITEAVFTDAKPAHPLKRRAGTTSAAGQAGGLRNRSLYLADYKLTVVTDPCVPGKNKCLGRGKKIFQRKSRDLLFFKRVKQEPWPPALLQ